MANTNNATTGTNTATTGTNTATTGNFQSKTIRSFLPQKATSKKGFHISSGGKVFPTLIILVIVLWAKRQNLFAGYPGIEKWADLILLVCNEILGFLTELAFRLGRFFHIAQLWTWFQNFIFFFIR